MFIFVLFTVIVIFRYLLLFLKAAVLTLKYGSMCNDDVFLSLRCFVVINADYAVEIYWF